MAFYRGDGTNHQGCTLPELWALSPFWLEHTHGDIQWLFPIPEAGRFNGFASLLSEIARAASRASMMALRRLLGEDLMGDLPGQ